MNYFSNIYIRHFKGFFSDLFKSDYFSKPLLILFIITITACNNRTDDEQAIKQKPSLDDNLRRLIKPLNLSGDPSSGRNLPSIYDPKAQLGKKLFFSKGLGGDTDAACVSCHHPSLGGGDLIPLPIGVGAEVPDLLGPGRRHANTSDGHDGGPSVPRNSPTTFNVALWDQVLFHDGRVESLGKTTGTNGDDKLGIRTPDSSFDIVDPSAGINLTSSQAFFPITSSEEMLGFTFQADSSNEEIRSALALRLASFGGWDSEFLAAFNDSTVTFPLIAEAIGEYERSQIFVNTPWKSYIEGQTEAISETAKRGAIFFFSNIDDGGANCASCHTGDFFTDEKFYVLATPQIGRGKNNGAFLDDDFGRFRETKDSADLYKFRTPSLLNVEVTGPWTHAGAYSSLENVVVHMLNPRSAINDYDPLQLSPTIQATHMQPNTQLALDQLENNRTINTKKVHRDVTFTEQNVTDLVEFLKTLTDPCVKSRSCLAPWIPNALDTNPDGLRLNAINNSGEFL